MEAALAHKSGFRKRSRRINTKRKSHYHYKNWTVDKYGERIAVPMPRHQDPKTADLIATYYVNPAWGTRTVHTLTFDLDAHRADPRWKDENGALDFAKMYQHLCEHEPPIAEALSEAVRSTGGKGLALAIAISPLEIIPETMRAQNSARTAQRDVLTILNFHGMGADPGALGLERDMMNFRNPKKLIDCDDIGRRLRDNRRLPIISVLLDYTNAHPEVLKTRKQLRLWPNIKTEKAMVPLYDLCFDEGTVFLTFGRLKELMGLHKDTIYKFLKDPPPLFRIEHISKWEGYRITLLHNLDLERRIEEVRRNQGSRTYSYEYTGLIGPWDVEDGERNNWLKKTSLMLKWAGVEKDEALEILEDLIKLIPDYKSSENCRRADAILHCCYVNRPQTFGKLRIGLPNWLKDALGNNFRESPKSAKKGTGVASPQRSDLEKKMDLSEELAGGESEIPKVAPEAQTTGGRPSVGGGLRVVSVVSGQMILGQTSGAGSDQNLETGFNTSSFQRWLFSQSRFSSRQRVLILEKLLAMSDSDRLWFADRLRKGEGP